LHFADIHKLLEVLQRLVQTGNTVLVIEHNLDVIKTADYLIDLGPEGGDRGGTIVAVGTPEEVAANERSYTGQYLVPVLQDQRAVGHHQTDARAVEALEEENLRVLDDLAKGGRVAVEA
jgi:excinuclease ABC subunit A